MKLGEIVLLGLAVYGGFVLVKSLSKPRKTSVNPEITSKTNKPTVQITQLFPANQQESVELNDNRFDVNGWVQG